MLGTVYTFYMGFFISFNPYHKHCDRHYCDAYFTKDKNALEMKKQNPSPPQHFKEVKRGEDKTKQKKNGTNGTKSDSRNKYKYIRTKL